MKTVFSLLSALFIFVSCNNSTSGKYKPEGLRKLENKEIIDNLVNQKMFNPAEIAYKSNEGVVLTRDSLILLMREGKSFGDQYVNKNDSVVEMIIRPMEDRDKILLEKIDSVRRLLMKRNK